jgi:hypothetical protein
MAYLQSHQELATHPKTRKASRRLGVSIPTMIGHLHLLWYWALDHAPEGDLSRFDPDDLADAAEWEGDPDEFVKTLMGCGPGDSSGFLDPDGKLHDWDEYGGKYGKRVAAARKAAAARWQSDNDAPAPEPQSDGNATASDAHAKGNAEERREEKKDPSSEPDEGEESFPEIVHSLTRRLAVAIKDNGHPLPREGSKAARAWLVEMDRLLRLGPPGGDDEQDPDEVADVIDWATSDPFWQSVIQSAGKFREKYAQLRLKWKNTRPKDVPTGPAGVVM